MSRLDPKDSYHMLFWHEAEEQLQQMEQALLEIEAGQYQEETVNHLFRMAHSLKGSSATLALQDLMLLAHAIESVLTCIKSKTMTIEPVVVSTLLEGLDALQEIHRGLFAETYAVTDVSCLADRIERMSKCKNLQPQDRRKLTITFEPDEEMLSLKALIIVNALEPVTEILSVTPEAYETTEDEAFGNVLALMIDPKTSEAVLREVLDEITGIAQVQFSCAASNPEMPEINNALKAVDQTQLSQVSSAVPMLEKTAVKVNIQKIDQLINLVGELIIDKESLHSIANLLKQSYRKDKQVLRMVEVCEHLDYLGAELQEIVLSTRMLPLGTLFDTLPRMVRDLSLKCSKQIAFQVTGQDQGIDRGMIEALMDPLNHLLRNAIDHGIELPEERVTLGKPAQGLLKLSASQGDNHILIQVEDDGRGIAVDKVMKKAIEKGLVDLEEVAYLTDQEWLEFVFAPGFSTASEVSDISGRGVGLDVVKSNINKLSGIIDIQTQPNIGTRFIIKLPLTLAIIKAMLIKEGTCTFAIPISTIIEVFRLKETEISERIHSTGYSHVLHWRETSIPLFYLGHYFEIRNDLEAADKYYVVVIAMGEKKTAMVVERILGEQEIVIKSMADYMGENKLLGALEGISGVSILGDGGLAHILDVSRLVRS